MVLPLSTCSAVIPSKMTKISVSLLLLNLPILLQSSHSFDFSHGTFSLDDYSWWLRRNHTIELINYLVKVGDDVTIQSPIRPVPTVLHWFSLNMENELPKLKAGNMIGLAYSHFFSKFIMTYNRSWPNTFHLDRKHRWLRIRDVRLDFADVYRVYAESDDPMAAPNFDVAIDLVTYENLECGFHSRPVKPRHGETVVLFCSAVVNGPWKPKVIFTNSYDNDEVVGTTAKSCGYRPSIGTRICGTIRVRVTADVPVLDYRCQLKFPKDQREKLDHPIFSRSKWTTRFQKKAECILPVVKVDAIPSDIEVFCGHVPCGETVEVGQAIWCRAHGSPHPTYQLLVFRIPPSSHSEKLRQMLSYIDELENFLDHDGTAKFSDTGLMRYIYSMLDPLTGNSGKSEDLGKNIIYPSMNLSGFVHRFRTQFSKWYYNLTGTRMNESEWVLKGELSNSSLDNALVICDFIESKVVEVGEQLHELLQSRNISGDQANAFRQSVVNKITRKIRIIRNLIKRSGSNPGNFDDDTEAKVRDEVADMISNFRDFVERGAGDEMVTKFFWGIVDSFIFPGFKYDVSALSVDANGQLRTKYSDSGASGMMNSKDGVSVSNDGKRKVFITTEIGTTENTTWYSESENDTRTLAEITQQRDETAEYYSSTGAEHNSSEPLEYTIEYDNFERFVTTVPNEFSTDDDDDDEDDEDEEGDSGAIDTTRMTLEVTSGVTHTATPHGNEEIIHPGRKYLVAAKDVGLNIEVTCNASNQLGWGYSSIHLNVVAVKPATPMQPEEKLSPGTRLVGPPSAPNTSSNSLQDSAEDNLREYYDPDPSEEVQERENNVGAPSTGRIGVDSAIGGKGDKGILAAEQIGSGGKVGELAALKSENAGSTESCVPLQLFLLFLGLYIAKIEF